MSDLHRTAEYARFRRKMRPIIRAQGTAPCIRCGRELDLHAQRWDLGHHLDVVLHPDSLTDPENVGPEHIKCNRSAGGKLGKQRQTARAQRIGGFPTW